MRMLPRTLRNRHLALGAALAMTVGIAPIADAVVSPSGGTLTYGSDGRLTFLLMGSDFRVGQAGDRTDTIIVLSINPSTHKVAAASIPRDTVQFPRAATNGGGTSGNDRVNFMMDHYSHSYSLQQRLAKFTKDVETALGIKIDYYAYVRFDGFDHLLDAMGGLTVSIPKAITDKNYDDYNGGPVYGVHFPVANNWQLGGNVANCPDWHVDCHRALPYVRSRHGTIGGSTSNSDWKRASRQQQVVMAAMQQVLSGELGGLVNAANDGTAIGVTTNAAISTGNAQQLYDLVNDAAFSQKVVFQPNTWAVHKSGTPIYTYTLRLSKVRDWVDTYMPDLTP